jgi:hypothetical protein
MSEEFDVVKAFEYCLELVYDWGGYVTDYFKEKHGFNDDIKTIENYIEYAKAMQAKFDEQEKELAALRGFAGDVMLEMTVDYDEQDFISIFMKWGLITSGGNPTPLLTGVKE